MLNEQTKERETEREECQQDNFRDYNIEGQNELEISIRATKNEWKTVVEVEQEREASRKPRDSNFKRNEKVN